MKNNRVDRNNQGLKVGKWCSFACLGLCMLFFLLPKAFSGRAAFVLIQPAPAEMFLLSDTSSVGEGLYETECVTKTFYKITLKVKPGRTDTIKTPYDSVVCRLVPIKGKYPITRCDSVWHFLYRIIDSVPARLKSVPKAGGTGYDVVTEYRYDTTDVYDRAAPFVKA